MDVLGLLQWPAMVVTLVAAWLVASKHRSWRHWGFAIFILSNLLWIAWGWHTSSYALIVLQVGLFFMNWRGARQNPDASSGSLTTAPERGAEQT
jgi:hypothetical protein